MTNKYYCNFHLFGQKWICLWTNTNYQKTIQRISFNGNDVQAYCFRKPDRFLEKAIKSWLLAGASWQNDYKVDYSQITSFQKKVFNILIKTKPGQLLSYQDIARKIKSSPRAVGQALKSNPFPLLYPCHRVVKKDGELGGFGGEGKKNIEIKKILIMKEMSL